MSCACRYLGFYSASHANYADKDKVWSKYHVRVEVDSSLPLPICPLLFWCAVLITLVCGSELSICVPR